MSVSSGTVEIDEETQRKRDAVSRAWAIAVMCWALIRTLIVWAALGGYGLNPWIYLVIDLSSAAIDAVTTPKMVLEFIDGHYRPALFWAVVSLAAFLAPDVYIFLGTRTLPVSLVIIVASIIGVTLGAAVFSVLRKVRAGRRAVAAAQTQSEAP
jgi:hypothetical protein